jgi:hypothetical protein
MASSSAKHGIRLRVPVRHGLPDARSGGTRGGITVAINSMVDRPSVSTPDLSAASSMPKQVIGDTTQEPQLEAVRIRAVESRTPAQMARRLGLDPKWLAEILARRFGVHLSRGARRGHTFTGNDRKVFDAAMKERLFAAAVDEVGAQALVTRATAAGPDWWTTSGGQLATSVAGLAGIDMAFAAKDRTPIPRWQSRMVWAGFAFSCLLCIALVGILFLWLWRWSYFGWRDGSKSSPTAAVALGVLGVLLLVAGAIAGVVEGAGATATALLLRG